MRSPGLHRRHAPHLHRRPRRMGFRIPVPVPRHLPGPGLPCARDGVARPRAASRNRQCHDLFGWTRNRDHGGPGLLHPLRRLLRSRQRLHQSLLLGPSGHRTRPASRRGHDDRRGRLPVGRGPDTRLGGSPLHRHLRGPRAGGGGLPQRRRGAGAGATDTAEARFDSLRRPATGVPLPPECPVSGGEAIRFRLRPDAHGGAQAPGGCALRHGLRDADAAHHRRPLCGRHDAISHRRLQ